MGFKDDVREKANEFENDLRELGRRVGTLEVEVRSMRRGTPRTVQAQATAARSEAPATTAGRSTLDYAAVAFGLAEIKAKVAQIVPAGREGDMAREWRGTVDYFADVFAKADPQFNRDEFARGAQR